MSVGLFFKMMYEYGSGPVMLVLTALIGYLIKRIDSNGKKDEERAAAFTNAMKAEISEMEEHFERRFNSIDHKVEDLTSRVSCVERDYLPREDHFRFMGGWRTELDRLYDAIMNSLREKK